LNEKPQEKRKDLKLETSGMKLTTQKKKVSPRRCDFWMKKTNKKRT
jgi:hypothetical protein